MTPEAEPRIADAAGRLVVADLAPGRVVLTTAGADPGDGVPTACAIAWQGSRGDISVVLVETEPRTRLTADAVLAEGARSALPPKLYLARQDGIRERIVPQHGVLRDGAQQLQFRVSPGIYEVGVLPIGELSITAGGRIEVGTAAAHAAVTLAPNAARTRLQWQRDCVGQRKHTRVEIDAGS